MKIICIGRNYIDHAKELNNPVPKNPLVFIKPDTALVRSNKPFFYPEFTQDLHYECEVVLSICKNGKYVDPKFAHEYFDKVGLGIDFTARDIQRKCKEKGHPWEIAKGFDGSAPVGELFPKDELMDANGDIQFQLAKNGETVQTGDTKDLIFDFATIISYVSKYFRLHMGDMIFTGTPAGVGPTVIGDVLEGYVGKRKILHCTVK